MVFGIIGENCSGKSNLAEKIKETLGGEIITLGSDAHDTANVGCAIRERQELLKKCGFEKFCTFEKMEPIWHKL